MVLFEMFTFPPSAKTPPTLRPVAALLEMSQRSILRDSGLMPPIKLPAPIAPISFALLFVITLSLMLSVSPAAIAPDSAAALLPVNDEPVIVVVPPDLNAPPMLDGPVAELFENELSVMLLTPPAPKKIAPPFRVVLLPVKVLRRTVMASAP